MIRPWLRKQFWVRNLYYSIIASPLVNRFPVYRHYLKKRVNRIHQTLPVPNSLSVELTTICNAKCSFCPNHRLPPDTMSMPLFKKIVLQAKEAGVRHLTLTGVGETLMDKYLFQRLDFLKDLNFERISFFTNASLLTPQIGEKLLDSPVTHILFSIDTVDPETYYSIRKLNFEKVERNLISFAAKARGKIHMTVASVFIDGGDIGDVKKVYERYKESGVVDLVTFVRAHNWGMGQGNGLNEVPCDYLWHNLFVRTDGKMVICCLDWDSEYILGDLNETPFDELISGPLQQLKEKHMGGGKAEIPICASCTHIPDWWVTRYEKS